MTFENIREQHTRIREAAARGDEEAAHSFETTLWHDTLRAIAKGADAPAALAFEALRTAEIHFDRY